MGSDAVPTNAQPAQPAQTVMDVERFYRENYARFVRLAVQFVDTREDAEDLVQDVFTRLIRNDGLRAAAGPDRYALTAILNAARSALRQRRVRRLVALPVGAGQANYAAEGIAEDVDLARAMDALPARQRQVVALRFYLDLDHRAIGQLLGISDTASATSLARALRRLAQAIGGPHERST